MLRYNFCPVAHRVRQPVAHGDRVNHSFPCSEGLANNDDHRFLGFQLHSGAFYVDWVNVRKESEVPITCGFGCDWICFQRLVDEVRPEIGAANTAGNKVHYPLTSGTHVLTTSNELRELLDSVQNVMNFFNHIHTVDHNLFVFRGSQSRVQNRSIFCDVNFPARDHSRDLLLKIRFLGQLKQEIKGFAVGSLPREIKVNVIVIH
mmetsp:Transcript_6490/g.9290  ORF Transcript_6490/g.9290 Transcript_6490/m.9290 type:complete len:204 (-) Transcript_6490:54-665(-)